MSYVALYRTYRPQSFKEVAGQEHITRTLKNAIKNDKFAHAYLFSGPRGTGKTTIAKIVAKAVNCTNLIDGNPCCECESCKSIAKGNNSDCIEIDAASNNGVDEIREIRDRVKFLPSQSKYKVYIIDEVHMLSTGAFNALLKTLEEPPKHVIFILATTEPYKIPLTILSRCQRFDFRGVSIKEMTDRIEYIADKENIKITKEAIYAIASSSEGGMRDALSLLDQAISYTNDMITEEDIHMINCSVSTNVIIDIVNCIVKHDNVKTLELLDSLLDEGKEIPRIIADLIQFLRDILINKNVSNYETNRELFANPKFIELTKLISNKRIYKYLSVLNEAQNNIKWTNQKRAFLELALIKMSDFEEIKDVIEFEKLDKIEERINALEKNKPVVQIKEEVFTPDNSYSEDFIEPVIEEKTLIVEKKVTSSKNNLSAIHQIEDILSHGNKEKKEIVSGILNNLDDINDSRLEVMKKCLNESFLCATNDYGMIISVPDTILAKKLNRNANKDLVLEIINNADNLITDYIALPEDVWQDLRNEFVKQWKLGNKNPDLSAIDISLSFEEESKEPIAFKPCTQEALKAFGENKVKIEEE